MIPVNKLIEYIEEKLNGELPSFIENTRYEFAIFDSVGEFKRSTREGNEVTKYINYVVSTVGDEKTGINEQTMTLSVTTKIDFLIPDAMVEKEGTTFANAVTAYINSAFALPDAKIESFNNLWYNIVGVYSAVIPGTVEVRSAVGESLTASAYIDWVATTQGYSSSNVELSLNNVRIYYSRLDISRVSTQESNIGSDSNGVAKSLNIGSELVISIIKPDRMDLLDRAISGYQLRNENSPISVNISWPNGINTDGTFSMDGGVFNVIIRDATKGAQGLDIPSNTCTLVEWYQR